MKAWLLHWSGGILVGAALAVWYLSARHTPTNNQIAVAHQATAVAEQARAKALPELTEARNAYTAQRAVVLASGNATPRELATIRVADVVLSSVDKVVAADSLVIHAQQVEIKAWQTKQEPRTMFYAEAMYDVARLQPIARAGVLVRIIGPLALTGSVEYALPNATMQQQVRGLVGVRVTF